jgi:hypothetical protein
MTRSDPAFAEQQLLQYARSFVHGPRRLSVQEPRTVTQLAAMLDLTAEVCGRALRVLADRGELRLLIHPGGRYELKPGRSSREQSVRETGL